MFVPKCFTRISKSFDDNPVSTLVLSLLARPSIPIRYDTSLVVVRKDY
jgi:hypothetical protein